MLDDDAWECIGGILSAIDQHRRPPPGARPADVFGGMHLILFGHSCTHARMSHRHFAHPPRFTLAPRRALVTSNNYPPQLRSLRSSCTPTSAPTSPSAFCGRTGAYALGRALKIGRKSSRISTRSADRRRSVRATPHVAHTRVRFFHQGVSGHLLGPGDAAGAPVLRWRLREGRPDVRLR